MLLLRFDTITKPWCQFDSASRFLIECIEKGPCILNTIWNKTSRSEKCSAAVSFRKVDRIYCWIILKADLTASCLPEKNRMSGGAERTAVLLLTSPLQRLRGKTISQTLNGCSVNMKQTEHWVIFFTKFCSFCRVSRLICNSWSSLLRQESSWWCQKFDELQDDFSCNCRNIHTRHLCYIKPQGRRLWCSFKCKVSINWVVKNCL